MKRINSLTVQIPIILSIIIIIVIVSMSVIFIIPTSKTIEKNTVNGFENILIGFNSTINMIMREQLSLIETYATTAIIIQFAANPNDLALYNNLKEILVSYDDINYYSLNIGVASIEGRILIDNKNPDLEGVSLAEVHPESFKELRDSDYSVKFDGMPQISRTTGANALLIMRGIRNKAGKLFGIMYINLDLDKVNKEIVSTYVLEGSERLNVINKETRGVLLSSDDSLIGTTLDSTFDIVKTKDHGVIDSYKLDGGNKRTAIFDSIEANGVPWTAILAKDDADIYKDIFVLVKWILILSIVMIVLSVIVIFAYVKNIMKPLGNILQMAKDISQGDLSKSYTIIKSKNEFGLLVYSFNAMRSELVDIINKIYESVEEVKNSAEELSKGSDDLARRTETQAASLEETASSMEEMSSTIKSSTEQSVHGNEMMIASSQAIEEAGEIILETTKNIEGVYEASAKIKDITSIIENIAFQTNILALNAAVEAARAGDQGKGFAVVASEVRNLAQTTQSSAKDITNLVDNAYEQINKATDTARSSQEIFYDVRKKIDETSRIMKDISSTAVEQNAGVEQVNKAVADMDNLTQQNAA
ncbi:methyl-accepting chemotaxis protein [Brachyspira sp.]|uniref:methyl-accepting chemotaxis protein n=1 Tax=Brachyspira sp. TaxID=1977261 RepID=UPI002636A687|nr:methyl-accepting chemotaxis protein [Brachyspira sp.]